LELLTFSLAKLMLETQVSNVQQRDKIVAFDELPLIRQRFRDGRSSGATARSTSCISAT
jgi:hypothetical protein